MSRSGIQMTFASSLLVIGLLSSSVADASGGYSGRPGGTSSNDPTYHRGKSLFHGRDREFRGLEVCLAREAETVSNDERDRAEKIQRTSIRRFKRKTVLSLAQNLVHCKQPTRPVGNDLDAKRFQALLYYLNKRYELDLRS